VAKCVRIGGSTASHMAASSGETPYESYLPPRRYPPTVQAIALALVLEGVSRSEAAAQNGTDRQTLCDWVRRYNDLGIEGLKSGSSSGRKPSLNCAQRAELLALAVKGPDPETDRVVRCRCVDLRDEVNRRFSVTVHESTIGVWLREMKLTGLQPRPFHPK